LVVLLAVGTSLLGLYLEYRFERSVRQEALSNSTYMRGLCAYHESHPRFDSTFGEHVCNPIVRQGLRVRHALLYHPVVGTVMGLLAILTGVALGLVLLMCLFCWNDVQMVGALAPLCSSRAAEILAEDARCTGRVRAAVDALGAEVFRQADETCASKHLLLCTQLVAPMTSASTYSAVAFLVAAAPLTAMWPLLQKQLASVLGGMLMQVPSGADS